MRVRRGRPQLPGKLVARACRCLQKGNLELRLSEGKGSIWPVPSPSGQDWCVHNSSTNAGCIFIGANKFLATRNPQDRREGAVSLCPQVPGGIEGSITAAPAAPEPITMETAPMVARFKHCRSGMVQKLNPMQLLSWQLWEIFYGPSTALFFSLLFFTFKGSSLISIYSFLTGSCSCFETIVPSKYP